MKVRDVLRKLKADHWVLDRVRGSHHVFLHPRKSGSVTVAFDQEGDELKPRTLQSIFKQAGWK